MSENNIILIVEDARELAGLLSDYLVQAGYQTHQIYDGDEVVSWVQENRPLLILLDLMLPGENGVDICRSIREFSDLPIIMITAKIEEQDRLTGLEVGADDYICKPFSPREVVARVKAVLRRAIHGFDREQLEGEFLKLDQDKLQATLKGHPLSLTVVEFYLLQLLAEQPGRVFSRGQLIEKIYPDQRVVSDRTIDSHVKKLRKKMSEVYRGELVHSVYSAGYKFEIV